MTHAHPGTPVWNKTNPRRSAKHLTRFYGLDIDERVAAQKAAERVEAYDRFFRTREDERNEYEGETANELVNRLLPDAHPRRKAAVMDVALAVAEEHGVDMTSFRDTRDYLEDVA